MQAIGVAFLLFGLAGLVLPFLQGILFLVIGTLILSAYSPRIKAFVERFAYRHPSVRDIVLKAEKIVLRICGEEEKM